MTFKTLPRSSGHSAAAQRMKAAGEAYQRASASITPEPKPVPSVKPPAAGTGMIAWSDERVTLLKRLHADGFSASQIAERLGGTTRNSVIGKLNRVDHSPPSDLAKAVEEDDPADIARITDRFTDPPPSKTPEQKARVARRTLINATTAMILCARANGVTDDRLKLVILALRSPEIAVVSGAEAASLIDYLELNEV